MLELNGILPWSLVLVTLVLMTLQSMNHRRQLARLEGELKSRYEELGRELHAVSSGSMGVGRRVMACEKHMQQIQRGVDELRQNDPMRVSYDEASRLVELGADIEDLMDTCGISRPEAELVAALNRRQLSAVG